MIVRIGTLLCLLVGAAPTMAANSTGQPVSVKNWVSQNYADGSSGAWTNNESGSSLGLYCTAANQCTAFLGADTGCDDGSKYPAMMNTDSGASSQPMTCANISSANEKPRYVLVFDDFQTVLGVVLKNHAIGFAIPLAGGMFKVMHFSLEGSNEALAAVSAAIKSESKKASLQDQVM